MRDTPSPKRVRYIVDGPNPWIPGNSDEFLKEIATALEEAEKRHHITAEQIRDVVTLSRDLPHAADSVVSFLHSRGLLDPEACPYTFAHTRSWCGNLRCREN